MIILLLLHNALIFIYHFKEKKKKKEKSSVRSIETLPLTDAPRFKGASILLTQKKKSLTLELYLWLVFVIVAKEFMKIDGFIHLI